MAVTSKPGTWSQRSQAGGDLAALPDSEQLAMLAKRDGIGPDNVALLRAQDIVYDAWDERDGRRRYPLAQKALSVSPFFADAWLILAARITLSEQDCCAFLERALAAGQLALGEGGFKRYKGSFWGMLETRPYMRARHALAQDLWRAGEHKAAIAHLEGMLTLNPGDNQDIRCGLLAWLVEHGEDEAAQRLLRKHGDGSAFMRYTGALIEFRKSGDSAAARRASHCSLQMQCPHPAPA